MAGAFSSRTKIWGKTSRGVRRRYIVHCLSPRSLPQPVPRRFKAVWTNSVEGCAISSLLLIHPCSLRSLVCCCRYDRAYFQTEDDVGNTFADQQGAAPDDYMAWTRDTPPLNTYLHDPQTLAWAVWPSGANRLPSDMALWPGARLLSPSGPCRALTAALAQGASGC